MERVALAGAGGITAKSAGPEPRPGHSNPSAVGFGAGLLNAIGLANPGADEEVALLAAIGARLAPLGVPLIASLFAGSAEEFGEVAARLAEAQPDMVEVNISCPNVASEMGEPFAATCAGAAAATRAVRRAVRMPVIVKLAPNVPDIASIARAAVDEGADAICAINTMPGMLIDAESGQPVLSNLTGGISGAALKPVALHAVYQIASAVDVAVIGTGGVSTGQDVIEMLSAGATAVGIGSVVAGEGPAAFTRILSELAAWLTERNLTVGAARGRALSRVKWPEPASRPPVPHDQAAADLVSSVAEADASE
jgi:dihydroorotate dehydrogenase (NAD+) catalytic subunit